MDSGFTSEQFDLLAAYGGLPSDNIEEKVIKSLRSAHDATKRWAEEVKRSLFPGGRIASRRAPINQGGNIASYTWAKVYPSQNAPDKLAYTVGIDRSGAFVVKIDTVNADRQLRANYEVVRGPTFDGSSIAKVISAVDGLRMNQDELVSWSIEAIRGFDPGYDELVHRLGLEPPMELITDHTEARRLAAHWREAMLEGAIERGRMLWIPDAEIVADRPKRDDQGRITLSMGVDPLSDERAVSIVDPLRPGSRNPFSNFARDFRGRRFLIHQARLSSAGTNIMEGEFLAASGLRSVPVHAEGDDAKRVWLLVADLDAPLIEIRRSTGRFVHDCAVVRSVVAAARLDGDAHEVASSTREPWFARVAPDEVGGTYIIGPREAVEERVVIRKHGLVSMTLRSLLGEDGIVMRKLQHPLRFEIDAEVLRPNATPLLIEIKTSISSGDIHCGIGQLHFYSRLIPGLDRHKLVLLLPTMPAPEVVEAIEASGIAVHSYHSHDGGASGDDIVFSDVFMSVCRGDA